MRTLNASYLKCVVPCSRGGGPVSLRSQVVSEEMCALLLANGFPVDGDCNGCGWSTLSAGPGHPATVVSIRGGLWGANGSRPANRSAPRPVPHHHLLHGARGGCRPERARSTQLYAAACQRLAGANGQRARPALAGGGPVADRHLWPPGCSVRQRRSHGATVRCRSIAALLPARTCSQRV
jgi:hypothetical protein